MNFSQFEPLSISTVNPNLTDAYAMNYNLNIQRELPGQMILQVGYVGAQGRHLDMVYEGNPISPAGTAECAADPTCIANRDNQAILYPSHSMYAPGNIFASVGVQGSQGVSNYNSLQVQLQKRLARGLMFQAAYTWSHSIDDSSGYEGSGAASGSTRTSNPFDFALNKGDSNFDARHRFVVNYTYELPIPRWNNAFGKYVVSGWRVAGITTLQTGFPIIVGDSSDLSLQCPVAAPVQLLRMLGRAQCGRLSGDLRSAQRDAPVRIESCPAQLLLQSERFRAGNAGRAGERRKEQLPWPGNQQYGSGSQQIDNVHGNQAD